ncbi:MAG: wax ester/triacylglycerol synthase family O-acyltransferase [Caldimonas sp.]
MKMLSGLDGAFLHLETDETPMHVASLHLFEAPRGTAERVAAALKRQVASRLHLAPIFRRKLAAMPLQLSNPVWVHDDHVDPDHHVQRLRLPRPGTLAQLEDCAARLHAERLDRSRPLWRAVVIDGLNSGQVALYIQIHHAVLDGQAGALLAQLMFDPTPKRRTVRRADAGKGEPAEHPGVGTLAVAALKHDAVQLLELVRNLPDVVRSLGGLAMAAASGDGPRLGENLAFGPKTVLNVPITSERGFAALSLPLDSLKRIAAGHDAKLNDVVLALCSGALRRWLGVHGGIPKKPLIAAMPFSLRIPGNAEFTTQATMTLVNLETHIGDPVKRLHAIRDAADAAKALARRVKGIVPTDFPSIGTPWVLHALASLYGWSHLAGAVAPIANLVVSNVAGPPATLFAAGARMSAYWPISIVEHGLGLNLTVMSYDGSMGFGFTTARSAVPDAHELTRALAASFDELVEKTRSRPPAKSPAARRQAVRSARSAVA